MIQLNTFYNEDCMETIQKMNNEFVDCVITSPPYNMTKRKGGYADKQPRYDDDRVLNKDTQEITDYQPLTNQANLQKRTDCGVCMVTSIRFDAKTLGYTKSVYEGSLKWEGTCVGCYWYDPIKFKESLT